jgi:hypothetical protein
VPPQALFGISVLLSFVVWGIVAQQYIWPSSRDRRRSDALRPILLLHSFRFVGLAFLIPGVVSSSLPIDFARPAAYGDLATATLALVSVATLGRRLNIVPIWAFNVLGATDLLYAFWEGQATNLDPGQLGAAYFIPTLLVPLLLITHGLVFRLLLRRETAAPSLGRRPAA